MSMRSIYRKIAKEHGVTVAEVKRDMQAAITHTYTHTPDDGDTKKGRTRAVNIILLAQKYLHSCN